jgi:hypothetical protein
MPRAFGCFCWTVLALLAPGAARADFFVHGYYTPTEGRVGHYLESDASFDVNDMPDPCAPVWDRISVEGALPPGMEVASADSSSITGTPAAAGNFPVVVTFHGLGCSVGSNAVERTIRVEFHINP